MSRIIKFRVWDISFKRMLVLHEAVFVDGVMTGAKGVNGFDSAIEVMQFTGMVDKNGKEIYEGDVICTSFEHKSINCSSLKHDPDFFHEIIEYEDGAFNPINPAGDYEYGNDPKTVEVIGNIWENPEFLKGKGK